MRRKWTWVGGWCVAVLLLVQCRSISAPSGPMVVEADRFRRIVTDLTDDRMTGRGPGTPGLDLARDYLVNEFRAVGLAPGAGESFTQGFMMQFGVEADRQSLAAELPGGVKVVGEPGVDLEAMGFSANAAFSGPLVFAGYGIVAPESSYTSYRGVARDALRGKVVVAFRYEPQNEAGESRWVNAAGVGRGVTWSDAASLTRKARWAADHGAAALLVINPPSQPETTLRSAAGTIGSVAATIPTLHVSTRFIHRILEAAGRDPLATLREYQARADAGSTDVEHLDVVLRGEVGLKRREGKVHNVVGWMPGTGALAEQVIVVGAHYDHLGYGELGSLARVRAIHPGADDNASGVAAMLMLARMLRDRPPVPVDPAQGSRSVLFVGFTAEERGMLGSMHMAQNLDELGLHQEQIAGMLNFDMVGRMRGNRLFVLGTGTGDRLDAIARDAGREAGLRIETSNDGLGASDHVAFHHRRIPAVHVFTGSHPDYHRPSDTVDKINAGGGARVAAFSHAMVSRLATDPRRLRFVESGVRRMSPRGFGGWLGVLPDYASMDSRDGCRIEGVMPGSPALLAGLQQGDIIQAWNDKSIRNLRSLMEQLREGKPGDPFVLEVRRGGEVIEVRGELGRR